MVYFGAKYVAGTEPLSLKVIEVFAEEGRVWGAGCAHTTENLFAFGSQNGECWCILGRILQLSCMFTAYGKIMPICVTDSDKPNEYGKQCGRGYGAEVEHRRHED